MLNPTEKQGLQARVKQACPAVSAQTQAALFAAIVATYHERTSPMWAAIVAGAYAKASAAGVVWG